MPRIPRRLVLLSEPDAYTFTDFKDCERYSMIGLLRTPRKSPDQLFAALQVSAPTPNRSGLWPVGIRMRTALSILRMTHGMRKMRASGSDRRNLKQGIIRGLPGGSHRGRHPGIPAQVGTVVGIGVSWQGGTSSGLSTGWTSKSRVWPDVQAGHLAERPQGGPVGHQGAELRPASAGRGGAGTCSGRPRRARPPPG